MNFVMIAGHLGADPEVRFTSSGKKVTTLRIATRTRKAGQDETIWWRATIWGDQFDKMVPYLKKGSGVIVYGEMHKPELFTDREGKQQISSMELTVSNIQFSPFGKPEREGGQAPAQQPQANQHSPSPGPTPFGAFPESASPVNPYMKGPMASSPQGETFDDEVPF